MPVEQIRREGPEAKLAARADLDAPPLADLARLDEASFRLLFAGGPIKRVGGERFVRNVMIAVGNSNDPALAAVAVNGSAMSAAGARSGGLGACAISLG